MSSVKVDIVLLIREIGANENLHSPLLSQYVGVGQTDQRSVRPEHLRLCGGYLGLVDLYFPEQLVVGDVLARVPAAPRRQALVDARQRFGTSGNPPGWSALRVPSAL